MIQALGTHNQNPHPLVREENIEPLSLIHQGIDTIFDGIESRLPPVWVEINPFQRGMDSLGNRISSFFRENLSWINDWLREPEEGSLVERVLIKVVKLPAKAIRNILIALYEIIKEIAHTLVHPLNEMRRFFHIIFWLLDDLVTPRNWVNIGAGRMGSLFIAFLLFGTTVSPLFPIIIGAIMGAGILLLFGRALYEYFEQKEGGKSFFDYMKDLLLSGIDQVTEAFVTGMMTEMLFSGFQKSLSTPVIIQGVRVIRPSISVMRLKSRHSRLK